MGVAKTMLYLSIILVLFVCFLAVIVVVYVHVVYNMQLCMLSLLVWGVTLP